MSIKHSYFHLMRALRSTGELFASFAVISMARVVIETDENHEIFEFSRVLRSDRCAFSYQVATRHSFTFLGWLSSSNIILYRETSHPGARGYRILRVPYHSTTSSNLPHDSKFHVVDETIRNSSNKSIECPEIKSLKFNKFVHAKSVLT